MISSANIRNCIFFQKKDQLLTDPSFRYCFTTATCIFTAVSSAFSVGMKCGTVHLPGKDAAAACAGLAVPLLAYLLYLLKHGFLDDGLMCVGEDGLFLKGIVPLFLVPDRVGIGLEVHRTACVLPPFQNRHNGTAVPTVRVLRFLVRGLDSLQGSV